MECQICLPTLLGTYQRNRDSNGVRASLSFAEYVQLPMLSVVGIASIDRSYIFVLHHEKYRELMNRNANMMFLRREEFMKTQILSGER